TPHTHGSPLSLQVWKGRTDCPTSPDYDRKDWPFSRLAERPFSVRGHTLFTVSHIPFDVTQRECAVDFRQFGVAPQAKLDGPRRGSCAYRKSKKNRKARFSRLLSTAMRSRGTSLCVQYPLGHDAGLAE